MTAPKNNILLKLFTPPCHVEDLFCHFFLFNKNIIYIGIQLRKKYQIFQCQFDSRLES